MLWCRATFTEHFDSEKCRLFPTQQQLFDFIDSRNNGEDKLDIEGGQRWLPFSVEFPSEEEAVHILASRSIRSTPSSSASAAGRLFRKRSSDGDVKMEYSNAGRPKLALREDYSILYGETPLSGQSRMFLAATVEGLAQIVEDIEPLQQHLYEVIREKAACHMYLDVERERDYSAWRPVVHVVDSDSDSSCDDNDSNKCVADVYECESTTYASALETALWRPPRCCPWNCRIRADNSKTTTLLLRELYAFLREVYPELLSGLKQDHLQLKRDVSGCPTTPSEHDTFFEEWPLGLGVSVLVMRSVQQHQYDGKCSAKFSQHYVVKFDGHWFGSNGDVGRLVSQFIDYLYERVESDIQLHTALFYHDVPKHFPVLPSEDAPNLPFLPLRCVIDSGVYSRNRTMRCLGSCKLHKTSILALEKTTERMTDAVSLFFASLITLPHGTQRVVTVPDVSPPRSVSGTPNASTKGVNLLSKQLPLEETERYGALAKYIGEQWSSAGGVECGVSSIRRCGDRYLLFMLKGSRYCGNIGRQHRSNNVYISVDLHCGMWVQKCFDPECAGYRGPPQPLPPLVGNQCCGAPNVVEGTGGNRAVSLASHAALRTPFRPSQDA
ncbi:hypothetical protein, conserved [Trypanosoma brucei gambiense DAL972]|uniref:DNA-directed primase/polymerase protein n=1 Tax=Trypanosoma brucei gambiense (strain MHOM/CI/86/DAL972) TaxID=679716 RepID=C9ZPU3_TRYB9|nr:hypothetical protein, conserved [Trypanosoma brucei gambiense DAL972]CBH11421.1 hypothetical protein, conserved [Trypanosoma brucei gambiense DAL972]|eukprot:XP_011773708.1 hypothetical protein, conserved [Trypanosoma brucei gambiense DAL972]